MKLFFRLLTITSLLVVILGGVNFDLPKSQAQTSYTVETYGTIHSAGIQIKGVPTDVTSATMQYKKQNEITWKNGLDPVVTEGNSYTENYTYGYVSGSCTANIADCYYIYPVWPGAPNGGPMIKRVNGSIMYLEPNTTYDMRVTMKRSNGSSYPEVLSTVKTRPNEVAYGTGRTLQVAKSGAPYTTISSAISAATAGDTITVGAGTFNESVGFFKSGDTIKGPITVKGIPGQTIITGDVSFAANVHDIIVDGLKVTTTQKKVLAGENTSRITFQNNRFAGTSFDEGSAFYLINKNFDWLIQNNTIEGSIYNPIVSEKSRGLVVRNNTVQVGHTEDIIIFRGGPRLDTDIYGNYFEGSPTDDGLELEGGVNINVRVWDNTINANKGEKGTISQTPVLIGPVYLFRNNFYGAGQAVKVDYSGVGGINPTELATFVDFGPVFYFHNNFIFYGNNWDCPDNRGRCQFFRWAMLSHAKSIFRNNIIYGRTIQTNAIDNTLISHSNSYWGQIDPDYNLYWNGTTTLNPNAHVEHPWVDVNSVFVDPKFVGVSTSSTPTDLHLQATSPAINKGIKLNNINDNASGLPDIGRYEYGEGTGISLNKTVSHLGPVLSGDFLTYTISFQNGNTAVTGAIITDTVDTTKVTIVDQGGATLSGSTLTWNLGNLAAGASGTRTFKVQVK